MNVPTALLSTAALAAAAGLRACSPGQPFPECPHEYSTVDVYLDGRRTTVAPQLSGPGVTRDIPEYHDCQRFVVRGSGSLLYDSLFAVFRTTLPLSPSPVWATPATEILAWNDYGPLGLKQGQNCLYMWQPEVPLGVPPEWEAMMVHTADWNGPKTLTCADSVQVDSLPTGGTLLDVAKTLQHLPPDAFPQVARWGWSRSDFVQTINLDCASAWCEVLPRGVAATPSYFDELRSQGQQPAASPRIMHRYMVSGWYDEQLLAFDPDSRDPSNPLVPTGILGRFFPHSDLGALSDFGPTASRTWTLVGYIALVVPEGEPPRHLQKYRDTYGLHSTSATAHFEEMNKLFLCQGSPTDCQVPGGVETCREDDTSEPREWWARVEAPDGTFKIRCVTRRGHDEADVPATARWRWAINDEGSWERCVQGCCEMIGDS